MRIVRARVPLPEHPGSIQLIEDVGHVPNVTAQPVE